MSNRTSSHAAAHPYTQLFNWTSGKLCYWRNNAQYSEKTKLKLEKRLKDMVESTKQVKDFQDHTK